MNKFFKVTFSLLLILSLILNFALYNNLKKQNSSVENLFKYKKSYIKLIEIIGISPEESESFLLREKD